MVAFGSSQVLVNNEPLQKFRGPGEGDHERETWTYVIAVPNQRSGALVRQPFCDHCNPSTDPRRCSRYALRITNMADDAQVRHEPSQSRFSHMPGASLHESVSSHIFV